MPHSPLPSDTLYVHAGAGMVHAGAGMVHTGAGMVHAGAKSSMPRPYLQIDMPVKMYTPCSYLVSPPSPHACWD